MLKLFTPSSIDLSAIRAEYTAFWEREKCPLRAGENRPLRTLCNSTHSWLLDHPFLLQLDRLLQTPGSCFSNKQNISRTFSTVDVPIPLQQITDLLRQL